MAVKGWNIVRRDVPTSFVTDGLESYILCEVEHNFSVPKEYAIDMLDAVCRAVTDGMVIEDGVKVTSLFNISFFSREIQTPSGMKFPFKRQYQLPCDSVFCVEIFDAELSEYLSDPSIQTGHFFVFAKPFLAFQV